MSEMNEEGLTVPTQASAIKKNGFIVIQDRPCKVVEVATSKTGKHGSAKCNFIALDIFNGQKYTTMASSTHTLQVPNISKTEYTLVDINDRFVSLMSSTGTIREDLPVPDGELGTGLTEAFQKGLELVVTVCSSMKIEEIVSFKESSK